MTISSYTKKFETFSRMRMLPDYFKTMVSLDKAEASQGEREV
jgi:hypothetical protein